MTQTLTAEIVDRIMVMTIANPPMNVMTAGAWDALDGHIDRALAEDVRGIIVRGDDEVFCAGSNIFEMLDLDEVSGTAWSRRNYAVREKLRAFPWPTVAAIEGLCLGGGMSFALACDMRVAAEDVEFGLPEARVGLVGTANSLLRYLPPGKVKDMVYTGSRLSAVDAERWGVVERLTPRGEAFSVAMDVVRASMEMAPLAVRLYKSTIDTGMSMGLEGALKVELERLQECWGSEDRRAWVRAFTAERERRRAERARAAAEGSDGSASR